MPRETMTGRERWLAVLKRERPDRIPMDYWSTPEADAILCKYLGCATLDEAMRKLHIDPFYRATARYVGPPIPDNRDVYGVEYRDVKYPGGSYREAATHPLAQYSSVEEIERNFTWPSPDWYDVGHIRKEVESHPDLLIMAGSYEPFLIYCSLRGLEQGFADLIEEPDIVHYCLGKLLAFHFGLTLRTYEAAGAGNVQISFVSEDMGSQTGLMFSPGQVREFLLPGMKKMIDLAHEAGAFVIHHSDGAIREILPTMIEAGIDVLNPIQWRCAGMDREGLKRDFGDRVIFYGGVDNQQTLPFGSVADVRQEVIDNLRILGAGGGYILAPCHNIQAVTPPQNIVALYETGYADGW